MLFEPELLAERLALASDDAQNPAVLILEAYIQLGDDWIQGLRGHYVAIVDDQYRRPSIHAPTVGILLCTGKAGPVVRYSLASTAAPVAVADYLGLPADARAALPSAAELQAIVHAELDQQT